MRNKETKPPNALKHGIFSATAILPGEDPREFEALHSALTKEWEPAGATEEDAVLSIAKAMWRKARLQKFLEVKMMKNLLDPNHPSYDESFALLGFAAALKEKPKTAFGEYATRALREDRIKYFNRQFSREAYKSTADWAEAIVNDINSMLQAEAKNPFPDLASVAGLSQSSATVWGDLFREELMLDERLDAMIDRALKRLIQAKAMKQMLRQTAIDAKTIGPRQTSASTR
jgi:hypothetical protein